MTDREVPGLTIDDKSTRDIDDAIDIERLDDGWHLRISIADVGRVVKLGSEFDVKAKERVATRYYGSGNSPMLPRFLAERNLSLWPKRQRNVLVIDFTLGSDFETRAVDIYEATLRSRAKLTYSEVPAILADAKHDHHQLLSNAKVLAMGMLAKRRQKGAMVMYDLNNGWVSTEEGFLKKLENKDDVIGYIIIQEMMIRANAEVAQLGTARGVPLLYRNHNSREAGPELEALAKTIQEGLDHPIEGLDELRKSTHRLLEKATYGSKLSGHFGLSLPAYLHFTSPIRRYADLVNHRQIKAMTLGKSPPYTVEQVEEVAAYINAKILQDLQSRSEHEKQKAESHAQRALDNRRLDGLNPKTFERVVKVEARSGEDASEAFVEGYTRRLQDGRVPLVCMTVVVGEASDGPNWQRIKSWTIAWLWKHPEDAVSLLAQGTQVVGWAPVEYDATDAGPPHQKVFSVTARLGGDEATAVAKTSKEAKQRASVKLLALMAGVDPPTFNEPKMEAAPPKDPPPPPIPEGENAVGVLQEFCQKRNLESPVYTYKQTGPSHMPVIVCTCKFGKVEKTAVASAKKDAKQRAAQAVVETLK